MSKYSYFTTSDGRFWVVENKPVEAEWTERQKRLAKKTYVFVWVVISALGGLLGIFTGYKLFGGS